MMISVTVISFYLAQVAPIIVDRSPTWSPVDEKIAFSRHVDAGQENIWVFDLKSQQLTQVTDEGDCYEPAWSPDGSLIAYSHITGKATAEIRIKRADGTGVPKVLLHRVAAGTPDWSPDGERIAFAGSSHSSGGTQIMILTMATGEIVELTKGGVYNSWPKWSPSGNSIVFAGDVERDGQQLYLVNQYGSELRKITSGSFINTMPCWAPDGRSIAYVSKQDGNGEIYFYNVGDGQSKRKTWLPSNELEPSWSPDGKTIVVASDSSAAWQLYTINAREDRTSQLVQLMTDRSQQSGRCH